VRLTMVSMTAALAMCLAILAFPRALGDEQCESSGAKCGDSLLQRVELEATEIAVDEGEDPESQNYADWMHASPSDFLSETTYVNLNKCGGDTYSLGAAVAGPNCDPPTGGYPGLIILPGAGGGHKRQIAWAREFAGRGIVSMAVDACAKMKVYEFKWTFYLAWSSRNWMVSDDWEYWPFHGGGKMGINPGDISLMGYSAGAEFVSSLVTCTDGYCINKALTGSTAFKSLISIAGIKDYHLQNLGKDNLDNLGEISPAYFAVQAEDDHLMKFESAKKFVEGLQKKGVKAHLIDYQTGGHWPFKPSMFYEVSKFILAPNDYRDPTFPLWNDGDIKAEWEQFEGQQKNLACYENTDGIKPMKMMTFDTFNGEGGRKVCRNLCLQNDKCKGYDLLDNSKRIRTAEGGLNCFLYDQKCTHPMKHNGGSYSEFLTSKYTGTVKSPYCTASSAAYLGKTWDQHSSTNCGIKKGESENVGAVLIGETALSCAKQCAAAEGCTAFQLGVNPEPPEGKWVARCILKKNVVLNLCTTSSRWALYMKK